MADTISVITDGTVSGSGMFDQLMVAAKAHVQQEYAAGRITGSDYASVYLGVMQTVLQTAIQFQVNTEQVELLRQQTLQAIQQTALVTEQITKTTSETTLINQQVINTTNQNTTITKQQEQLDAQTLLISQQKLSEEAKIKDIVDSVDVVGTIGKQKTLYQAQIDGYARDAEQKLLKILVDTWTVRQTTDGDDAPSAGVDNPSILDMVNVARNGVGLSDYAQDSDADGVLDADEDANDDGVLGNDDDDGDGTANYLDSDDNTDYS